MTSDDKVEISASGGITVSRFCGKDEDNDYEEWRDTLVDLIRLKKLKHAVEPSFALPTRADASKAWTAGETKLSNDNDIAFYLVQFCYYWCSKKN